MPKFSDLIELAGFAFIAAAALHAFGVGAMELVIGIECLVVAMSLEGTKVHLPRKLPKFWRREK